MAKYSLGLAKGQLFGKNMCSMCHTQAWPGQLQDALGKPRVGWQRQVGTRPVAERVWNTAANWEGRLEGKRWKGWGQSRGMLTRRLPRGEKEMWDG